MASDGVAVLDALGIEAAHVMGASMGGMIAQRLTIDRSQRVLSLTSIMSTTGSREVGSPTAEAITSLLTPAPAERAAYLDHAVAMRRIVSGPLFDETIAREVAARAYDRCFYPEGAVFQRAAIAADGDRTEALRGVRCPTLVIHGRVDPLITLSGGEATAAAVPGAELVVFDEMGHDFPRPLLPEIVTLIAKTAARV
jgi:pimeloyl-ACP methyl ester carboxylesterase